MYKLAAQQRLRIQTVRGPLTVEQLFDLSLEDLDALAVTLETEYNDSKGKSFLTKTSVKDKTLKLKFDIVLDVLNTKISEMEAAREAKDIKEHNTKILELIAEKKDESLKGKTIAQLEKMLK